MPPRRFSPSDSLRSIGVAAALSAAACDLPTDQSPGMYVAIDAPSPVLLRGAVVELSARLWIRDAAGDSTEVANAELLWTTSDPLLASVSSDGRVTGVNSGVATIRAIAPGFQSATPAIYDLRIANPLEIDSVTPATVRYGELLVAHGVGVGSLFFAGLGNGTLGIDSLAVSGDPAGLGQRAFWVAYPASSGTLFAAGSGQLVAAPQPTVVLPVDIYEPNQMSPAQLALDGASPYPSAPSIRFYNPALAFEDLRGAAFGYDWYRWTTAHVATPYTFVYMGPSLRGTNVTYLTHDASSAGEGSPTGWRVGPGIYDCKGYEFQVPVAPSDSIIIALDRLPAGSIDLISAYAQQGRYALAVLAGYGAVDARIPRDRYEENDICLFADENHADPSLRIDLGTEFSENLTIDTPNEIDWLRITVPGLIAQTVTVRTVPHALPEGDRSDIDVYVLSVPDESRGLSLVGGNVDAGSSSTSTMLLEPGDYYVAVVDSAGVATHYGICIAQGTSCTLPSPPPSLGTAQATAMPALLRAIVPSSAARVDVSTTREKLAASRDEPRPLAPRPAIRSRGLLHPGKQ